MKVSIRAILQDDSMCMYIYTYTYELIYVYVRLQSFQDQVRLQ